MNGVPTVLQVVIVAGVLVGIALLLVVFSRADRSRSRRTPPG